jgi:protein arginine N-methyltransferase 1
MYTLHDYARMIADEARTGAYVRALAEVIRPGSIVADLGTGTGILAMVACRLGAGRVYAIDTNDAIEVARQLAGENGVADRIVFIQKDVREVQLPERVDVIVSDLRGVSPLCGDHLAVVDDVRSRFLKNSGILLPARDRLMAGVVGKAKLHEWALGPSHGPLGISLSAMQERLRHAACRDREADPLLPENILSTTAAWADIDYATVRPEPITGRASLRLEREGTGHGVALWFEAELTRDDGFSTAPGHELCYGRLFLPWPHPTPLRKGDDVAVEIWAQPDGEPLGWTSTVYGADGVRESFKQSSFLSLPSKPVGRSGSDGAGRLSQVGRS